jgi:cytochrome c553
MRNLLRAVGMVVGIVLLLALATRAIPPQAPAGKNLSWAFPAMVEKNEPPVPDPDGPRHLPGSSKAYTQAQIDDLSNAPDWYPDEYGPAPDIVKSGAANKGFACGSCHLMSGHGHPESADLAGLPAAYIIEQMADFKSGDRKDPARMNAIAQSTSGDDVRAAAAYFSMQKTTPGVKVVEADNVPVSYIGPGRMRFAAAGGAMEPIGNRIIEVPVDVAAARSRDPHTQFIAYVPTGSLAKGEALAKTGGGKTISCATCHGDGLKGMGSIPRLAGVHPIVLVRQLYNFQTGASNGTSAQLMQSVVASLSDEDILDLAAYAASLNP